MKLYLIDLHCHTQEKSFDGKVPAREIVTKLHQSGFHGVVFTDHSNVWSADELEQLRAEASLPKDFILFSGQEVHTLRGDLTIGDLLVYGPTESIPDGTEIDQVIELARGCGGFCLAPHPGAAHSGMGQYLRDYPVIGAETWNGRYGEKVATKSRQLAAAADLTEFGGSDAHRTEDIGGGGTVFPALPGTLFELGQLIRSGQCRPWKPGLLSRIQLMLGI